MMGTFLRALDQISLIANFGVLFLGSLFWFSYLVFAPWAERRRNRTAKKV